LDRYRLGDISNPLGDDLLNIFISYIFLGLSLSAPLGPINAAQLDKGLKSGFFHAWLVGLGALIADIGYMLIVYLGLVHLLGGEFVKTFLWLFGFFVLVYTGIESIRGAAHKVEHFRSADHSHLKSFLAGFLMSLLNPMSILFWLGIYGSVLAETVEKYEMHELLLYSVAIIIGIMIWDVCMAGIASTFRRYLTDRIIRSISIISGLSLIGFGIYFGIEAFKMLIH
jgi:L-lysine exporter family protein LysE/ArgO